jgi:hypothetical protein
MSGAFVAPTKIELILAARNLKDRDVLSKSDPFCTVSLFSPQTNNYGQVGKTEVIVNNLNPHWKSTIAVDYYFETKQSLRFSVQDFDEDRPDDLGEAFTTLGEIVSKGTLILELSRGGSLIIRGEEIKTSRHCFEFHFRGVKLDKKDFFGKSDPYLKLFRSIGESQWTEIHKTETVMKTLDPIWKPFELSEHELCNCDQSRPIRVECYDWDSVGSDELIGVFETTIRPLVTRGNVFELRNKNKPAGSIVVSEAILRRHLSFVDYLHCGVQISLSVAIDFTGSNGEYHSPKSLHHIGGSQPNEYERAIWEVGSILEAYDADRYFPVFGFGGVPSGHGGVSHCFPLNGNLSNPYVLGARGVLDLYRASLERVALSGPTLFHHLVDQTITVAGSTPPHAVYSVLLILTDGAIMDMEETVASVVQASNLPLSIIIVGVGHAEFDSMERLDCDSGTLVDNRGRKAVRDIVQFVPFRKFGGNPVALAAEVLKEIPAQLTKFMKMINYAPEVPELRPMEEIRVEVRVQEEHKHSEHEHGHH